MRSWLSVPAALVVSLFALEASANSGGLAGKSGKDGATCSGCHNGGAAPTVKLDGPSKLAAGESSEYTLTVTTALAKASAGIATDTGKLTAGAGLKLDGQELTHSAPVAGTDGTFKFTLKAPASGTSVKLFAVGLGSDGTGITGDGEAKTTLDIEVTGGGSAKAAGDDDDDGKSSSSGSTKKNSSSGGSDDFDPDDTGIPNSGCAAASHSTDTLSGLAVLAGLGLVLTAARRRRNP